MKITTKYVLREHLGPLTFAMSALTSLLLLNYISRKLGDLVGKGLPWQVIGEFMLLSIPFTVAMTLPMAVLVSVLYAFSRLAAENEITAFKASGVAMRSLLAPVLVASVGMAGIMVYFNDQVLPRANHRLTVLQGDIARTRPTFALNEQVLNEVTPQFIMRASRVERNGGMMREVTIYDLSSGEPQTIRADSGELAFTADGKDLILTLHDGMIERLAEGKPSDLNRSFYDRQLVRVRDVAKSLTRTDESAQSFKTDREMSICELQDSYLRSRKEYLLARLEYDQAIADSLGKPRPGAQPPGKVFLGIGRLYCQAVRQVRDAVTVQTAGAMEWQPPAAQPVPAPQPPAPAPAQDTTRRDSTVRRDTLATPAPTATPTATPATPVPALPPAGAPQPSRADTAALPGTTAPPAVPPGPVLPGAAPSSGVAPVPPDSAAAMSASGAAIGAGAMVAIARLRVGETSTLMNGYDIEIHKKFALAVACIVFVLLGAPVALRFPRGGVGLVIGMSLFVFALYYCFLIAGEELATRGYLPPWVSMWAANVLFGIVGLYLAARMGRETGSARGGGFGEWWDGVRHRRAVRAARRRPAAATPSAQGVA